MTTDFNLANVERVAQAYVDYYKTTPDFKNGFFIGYDHRENSEHFAKRAAEVIAGNGGKVWLSTHACPTQVVSFAVLDKKLCAGVMITASHNPPEYNGFKVKEALGCSSFPETTDSIMTFLDKNPIKKSSGFELYDPKPEYYNYINQRINFKTIKNAGMKIYFNPLFGSGTGYLPELLAAHGIDCIEINNKRDIKFGGFNPEPLAYNVPDLTAKMKRDNNKFAVGLVVDGDADRNGACGANGDFLNSQKLFSVLFHHFAENLKKPGKLVHAFNGTKLLDKLAMKISREVVTTKIGFKYIAEEIIKGGVLIGGEESGGYSASGNIPDRDGILNSLYLLELMAAENKNLEDIYAELEIRFGKHCYDRLDLHLADDKKQKTVAALKQKALSDLAGKKVVRYEELDGVKVHFADDGWVLFRASGTEPLLRIYCEASSEELVAALLAAGKAFAENQ